LINLQTVRKTFKYKKKIQIPFAYSLQQKKNTTTVTATAQEEAVCNERVGRGRMPAKTEQASARVRSLSLLRKCMHGKENTNSVFPFQFVSA